MLDCYLVRYLLYRYGLILLSAHEDEAFPILNTKRAREILEKQTAEAAGIK
jgi:hypothetical protein